MSPSAPSPDPPPDELLAEQPLRAYLGTDERLVHVLTNRRVGAERAGDTERRIEPGEACGAIAALTDRRVLLLVGGAEAGGDHVTSLPYADVVAASAETELLTATLRFETAAGVVWSFTARESDVGEVAAFLDEACGVWRAVSDALATVEGHCEALADALDAADWTTFDERFESATAALATARDRAADATVAGVDERVDRLEAELYRLARDRHVVRGEELLTEADRLRRDGDFVSAYDRIETARDRFADAVDAATEHGLDDAAAQAGLAEAEELATTLADEPLATARETYETALDRTDVTERIERLEAALDDYRAVADLVAVPDAPFAGDEAAVREAIEAVVDDLIAALVECGRERCQAGEWQWNADDDEAAYELLSGALDDFDRALELAERYHAGDADAIREERDDLADRMDPLAVRFELKRANIELEE